MFSAAMSDSCSDSASDVDDDEPDEDDTQLPTSGPLKWIFKTIISKITSTLGSRALLRGLSSHHLDESEDSALRLSLDCNPKNDSFESSIYEDHGFARSSSYV